MNIKFWLFFTFLFGLLLSLYSSDANASITFTGPSTSRLYTVGFPATVAFDLSVTPPSGQSITQVNLIIDGNAYVAQSINGSLFRASHTFTSAGTFAIKGVVTYANNSTDSTNTTNYKVYLSSLCGCTQFSPSTGYVAGDTVVLNDSVYRRISYWAVNDTPSYSSANWNFLGLCNSNLYKNYDCSVIGSWDASTTYSTTNTIVKNNNVVYANNYWTMGDNPDVSPGAWKTKGGCIPANIHPQISTSFPSDTLIVSTTFPNLSINCSASDIDGTIISGAYMINQQFVSMTQSGGSYATSFTPTAYGNYTVKFIATDDEGDTSTFTSTVNIQPSYPPHIQSIYPVQNAAYANILNLSAPIQLKDSVWDSDNAIQGVSFIVDNNAPVSGTLSGNYYVANWIPNTYGQHQVKIVATDVSNVSSEKLVNFSLIDPTVDTVNFNPNLFQLKMNLGITKTFTFDSTIQSVVIRNPSLAKVTVSGSSIIVDAYRHGRSGLKITTASGTAHYIGLRVNKSDGTAPGLPEFASFSSVSEDATDDLHFWESMSNTLTNKNVDSRYIYINGGPIGPFNSWRNPQRHINFCKNSLKYGLMPFFVYYNIPDGGESYSTDIGHARDTTYMRYYFDDLKNFIAECHAVMGDDQFGVVLEPDFLGYCQQLGDLDPVNNGSNNPLNIPTCVTATGQLVYNGGNVRTLVEHINRTINNGVDSGANVFWGWQLNLWSDASTAGGNGIMRSTDGLGWTNGRINVTTGASNVSNYIVSAGVLTHNAKFVSMDKYGLDAMGYSSSISNPWWFNSDHWNNYLLYAKTVHSITNKPVVLWQLPVGHINTSISKSAYTGSSFLPLNNTTNRYEDPSVTYFFGDTIVVTDAAKHAHLSANIAADSGLHVMGDTIVWKEHISNFKDAGVVHAMFGAGVGNSTNGVKDPAAIGAGPTDAYFQIQKMQSYYKNKTSWVDTSVFIPGIAQLCGGDTAAVDLKDLVGTSAINFYGYNNGIVSFDGILQPLLQPKGLNYYSFVDQQGPNAQYKIIRANVSDTPCSEVMAYLKVYLEGAWHTSSMSNGLSTSSLIPADQPFNNSYFNNYSGTESNSVISNDTNTVDWVLVELRDSISGNSVSGRAAFLKTDGTLVDAQSGNPGIKFSNVTAGNYYVIVHHRNHLSIASAQPVSLPNTASATYDFTTGLDKTLDNGTGNEMKELAPGKWGMWCGDYNHDYIIDNADKSSLLLEYSQGFFDGCFLGDINFDGAVDNLDVSQMLIIYLNGVSSSMF